MDALGILFQAFEIVFEAFQRAIYWVFDHWELSGLVWLIIIVLAWKFDGRETALQILRLGFVAIVVISAGGGYRNYAAHRSENGLPPLPWKSSRIQNAPSTQQRNYLKELSEEQNKTLTRP